MKISIYKNKLILWFYNFLYNMVNNFGNFIQTWGDSSSKLKEWSVFISIFLPIILGVIGFALLSWLLVKCAIVYFALFFIVGSIIGRK